MYSNQKEYIQSVEIHRDGLYSPWGFRLKGGIDVDGGIPLEIVKVRQIWSGHKNVLIHSNEISWSGHFSSMISCLLLPKSSKFRPAFMCSNGPNLLPEF